MRRRRNPGEDPFATRATSAAPSSSRKWTKGEKLFAGGAFLAGVLGVVAWKKGNLWSPYRAPSSPSPTPRAPSSAPRGYTPSVPQPSAPAADSSGDSAPVDPSQMVASFGDTPALPPGAVYDSPPGG